MVEKPTVPHLEARVSGGKPVFIQRRGLERFRQIYSKRIQNGNHTITKKKKT